LSSAIFDSAAILPTIRDRCCRARFVIRLQALHRGPVMAAPAAPERYRRHFPAKRAQYEGGAVVALR